MNKLLVAAMALVAVASFSALGMSIVNASNSNQEKIGNVPGVIAYQGYLTDDRDLPLKDGNHDIVFAIYESEAGANPTWEEKQTVITTGGVFSVLLGSNTALSEDLFTRSIELHLGITIDGGNEALPRQRLASVPFAIVANKAKTATTAENLRCNGCVTASHLAADAMSTGGSATTLTSPNGDFQIIVNNAGISLTGPDSELIIQLNNSEILIGGSQTKVQLKNGDVNIVADDELELTSKSNLKIETDSGDIKVQSSFDLDLIAGKELLADAGSKLNLDADQDVDIDAGSGVTVTGAGNVTLDGALLRLGGTGGCKFASSLGDPVVVPLLASVGTITGGSPLVQICN